MQKRAILGSIAVLAFTCGFTVYQVTVPDIETHQNALFRGFDELERQGAYVVGEENEKLGRIARHGSDALGSSYGAGSEYKSNGLFNPYSKYGSSYSSTSAFCRWASKPPTIVMERGGKVYTFGILTINKSAQTRGQRINPYLLRAWLASD